MSRKEYNHEIKAFAAFTTRGALIYGTVRPTKEQAQEALEHFNPVIEPSAYPYQVLPVFIGVDKGYQYDLEDAIRNKYR